MTLRGRLRLAVRDDAGSIAALHVASWRSAYRGIFSDRYLDGPVEAERQALWQARMRDPRPGQIVVLAEDLDGSLMGFACGFIDADPEWGSFVDNLHVRPDRKGGGVGRALMRDLGRRIAATAPEHPVHLFCLADNPAARGFYESLGGQVVERTLSVEADGSACADLRIVWASPAKLLESSEARASGDPSRTTAGPSS